MKALFTLLSLARAVPPQDMMQNLLSKEQKHYTIDDFHPSFFWNRPKEGLYNLPDWGFDGHQEGAKIMAMNDMDNDKHIDLVTVNDEQNTFTVHYYDAETRKYTGNSPTYVDPMSPNATIASIVPSKLGH